VQDVLKAKSGLAPFHIAASTPIIRFASLTRPVAMYEVSVKTVSWDTERLTAFRFSTIFLIVRLPHASYTTATPLYSPQTGADARAGYRTHPHLRTAKRATVPTSTQNRSATRDVQ
jgi:hypothetical protein